MNSGSLKIQTGRGGGVGDCCPLWDWEFGMKLGLCVEISDYCVTLFPETYPLQSSNFSQLQIAITYRLKNFPNILRKGAHNYYFLSDYHLEKDLK